MSARVASESRPWAMGSFRKGYVANSIRGGRISGERMFKHHKLLPHPAKGPLPTRWDGDEDEKSSLPRHLELVPPTLPHSTQAGGELPPTPPAQSQTGSSSQESLPSSSITNIVSPPQISGAVVPPVPMTPTIQQSPPTPKLTPDKLPPGPAEHRPKPQSDFLDPTMSKMTNDSRTASFKTAQEHPLSSDEDDKGKSTSRPVPLSAVTSQRTVTQASQEYRTKPHAVGLGLGNEPNSETKLTPTTKGAFVTFDGEWGSTSEVEQEGDDHLRRLRTTANSTSESSHCVDPKRLSVPSTTVSTVVEAILVETVPQRRKTLRRVRKHRELRDLISQYPPTSFPLTMDDVGRQGRLNVMSTGNYGGSRARSGSVDAALGRRARRDMWKSGAIPVVVIPDRQSSVHSNSKEPSLRSTSSRRSKRTPSLGLALRLSAASHAERGRPSRSAKTVLGSNEARLGDQRTMDFPPMVPTRSSSLSAPTSRNASRSQSMTTQSLQAHSDALQVQQAHQAPEKKEQTLPELQTSLAQPMQARDKTAPTQPGLAPQPQPRRVEVCVDDSRGSQPAHLHAKLADHRRPSVVSHGSGIDASVVSEGQGPKLGVDGDGDPWIGKRLSVQNTPFSQASLDTAGTSRVSQAEVSQAMAVNIYPHQNTSLMVVDHVIYSSQPCASSSMSMDRQPPAVGLATSASEPTRPDAAAPATPPKPVILHMEDVDSPLRNPRAPPHPPVLPVINFIPATPSGLTPTAEVGKQLGHVAETVQEANSSPSLSLFYRAFPNRHRHRSVSQHGPSSSRTQGLLTRTLSLSKNVGRSASADASFQGQGKEVEVPSSRPLADGSRLHPYWRPAYSSYDVEDEDEDDADDYHHAGHGRRHSFLTHRPLSDRPVLPRRSLSARIKRTFAILPIQDDSDSSGSGHEYAEWDSPWGRDTPDRRTIRRTPSGTLRVVRRRHSTDSLPQDSPPLAYEPDGRSRAGSTGPRPYSAPGSRADIDVKEGAHVSSRGRQHVRFGRSTSLPGFPFLRPGAVVGSRTSLRGRRRSARSRLVHLGQRLNVARQLGKRRRDQRNQELRQMISGPRELKDGVDDVVRPYGEIRGLSTQQRLERHNTAPELLF